MWKVGDLVKLRNGRKARIMCVDRKGCWPIGILIDNVSEESFQWLDKNGRYNNTDFNNVDIIGEWKEPIKYEGWINVYKGNGGIYFSDNIYKTKKHAQTFHGPTLIARIKISFTEGEGL